MMIRAIRFLATCELPVPPLGNKHVIMPATCGQLVLAPGA